MAHTNSTENYGLPQWIGTDKPTFLGDFNSAFATIDTGMKASADVATAAAATANAADATATSAATNATNAISIANNAASEAASATSAASSATATANTAKTTADSAMRASASNSIENLAPAYDNTLTYNVGDLVTFIDAQNSGKLYKCVVAVNTPMDFNINYWDDVTASEVYYAPPNFNASYTFDGSTAILDGLNAFAAELDFSLLFNLFKKGVNCTLSYITGTSYNLYLLDHINIDRISFMNITANASNIYTAFIKLKVNDSLYVTCATNASGSSFDTALTPTAGTKIELIIK